MSRGYTPTIGLEIHAELATESKLFCGCKNSPNEVEPNTYICPVCVGYPGALPHINKKAIEYMIRVGTALEGIIADFTEFDRKHYFYPDIPKGYQISQYAYPIVSKATLGGVEIQRVHLEEDTAKSTHEEIKDGAGIDFNRSGVPLMELVTEPVIRNGEEAEDFATLLQQTLQYLQVSQARMEWGEMRVEANISVSKDQNLGTKVEVKNLNSFKAVRGAIEYEIERQIAMLEEGKEVVQETRGWNESSNKTFSQRIKETSEEYRYMPEPDLPKFYLHKVWDIQKITKALPELPAKRLQRYTEEYGLPEKQANTLIKNKELGDILHEIIQQTEKQELVQLAANYLTSDILQYSNENTNIYEKVTSSVVYELVTMLHEGEISSRAAKDIIANIVVRGGNPREIAEQEGLFQKSDDKSLGVVVKKIVQENQKVVQEYQNGKDQALQYLVGKGMKETKGAANPKRLAELLKELI